MNLYYEIWNYIAFVTLIFRGKFKMCIFNKNVLLIINLHDQQFSDLAKNWQFKTPIIVNISVPHRSILKQLIY